MTAPVSSRTINLKWNHRGTYHRFEIPHEAGCSTLMERITTIFPNFYGQIGWKDEDGDMVIISSDEELMHAASLPQNQHLLRLFTIDDPCDDGVKNSSSNSNTPNGARKKQTSENASLNGFQRDCTSTDPHSSNSKRLLLMAREQLMNTQKLFRKSIRNSSSGTHAAVTDSETADSSERSHKKKEKKTLGSQPHLKLMFNSAKRRITGNRSKRLAKSAADDAVNKVTVKTKSLSLKEPTGIAKATSAATVGSIKSDQFTVHEPKADLSVKTLNIPGKKSIACMAVPPVSVNSKFITEQESCVATGNDVQKGSIEKSASDCDLSLSSDSDIEIIEKYENNQTHETDDWTLVNSSAIQREATAH